MPWSWPGGRGRTAHDHSNAISMIPTSPFNYPERLQLHPSIANMRYVICRQIDVKVGDLDRLPGLIIAVVPMSDVGPLFSQIPLHKGHHALMVELLSNVPGTL